ncbi:hypothetical protein Tco_0632899 [Tanacetum coccineum]
MSNSNTNLQTQSSNALHNAIMEAGSKDRPPMLAPGNYVQWKSIIKRYIDTKPNSELIHYCLQNPPYTYQWTEKTVPVAEGSSETTTERYMENYKNVSQDIRDQLNAEAEAVQIILTGIDNDIYSTVDACPNACEMWKAIERLKQGESINVQDLETNLYWEFGKFTSRDGESLESYYSRFYKMMNELVRNQCHVTNHQVNVQFLLQLQPEWQRSQQSIRNRGKTIVTSSAPTYDPEPATVTEDKEMSKEKEIDKLIALISLSFKKIYKPTNNNLRTSSNTSRANQDNSPKINRGTGYDNQRAVNIAGARENVGTLTDRLCIRLGFALVINYKEIGHVSRENGQQPKRVKDATITRKRCYCANNGMLGSVRMSEKLIGKDDSDERLMIRKWESNKICTNETYSSGYQIQVQDDQDDTDDLDQECDLLASLIQKIKCEIDDSKNRKYFWEKCEHLEKELSKSRTMSKNFEALQKHAINLELDLLQCKEKIKNDKSFKENQSNIFLKEREQYFEIQDLKAQLQDKGIAISELKKLIEKMKGKSVETKFEKSSVIRQLNAFKSQRQSILGKPAIFSNSLAKTDFSKSKSVTIQNVSHDFFKNQHCTDLPQNGIDNFKNTNLIAP